MDSFPALSIQQQNILSKATQSDHEGSETPQKYPTVCEEPGLTKDSQPGRSGSDGGLYGLALVHGIILEVSSQDFQVVLSRQMVSYDQIARITCPRQSTGQEVAGATSPGMRRAEPQHPTAIPRIQGASSPPWQPAWRERKNLPNSGKRLHILLYRFKKEVLMKEH